jgi:peptidyl-prolyl cis-trans isomerase C
MIKRTLSALCVVSLTSVAFAQEPATPVKPAKIAPVTPAQLQKAKEAANVPKVNLPKKTIQAKRMIQEHALKDQTSEVELPPVVGQGGLIAKVNGEAIPLSEFSEPYDRFAQTFKARKRSMPARLAQRYRKTIAKRLVDEKLIEQEAARLAIKPTPSQLDEELKGYKAMFQTEERFQKYLDNANLSLDKVKENLTQQLLFKLLIERNNIGQISDDEVKAQYERQRSKYEEKEKVRASHILIKLDKAATPEQVAAAKAKADLLAARARAGEDFAELAKANSEGPTASRGGDLNFFGRGRMVKEFDEKVFSMKVGEVSDPVRTRFGWHVIKVTEYKEAHTRTLEEVKDNIRRMLEGRAKRKAKADLVELLRSKAQIEVYLPAETATEPVKVKAKPKAEKK